MGALAYTNFYTLYKNSKLNLTIDFGVLLFFPQGKWEPLRPKQNSLASAINITWNILCWLWTNFTIKLGVLLLFPQGKWEPSRPKQNSLASASLRPVPNQPFLCYTFGPQGILEGLCIPGFRHEKQTKGERKNVHYMS